MEGEGKVWNGWDFLGFWCKYGGNANWKFLAMGVWCRYRGNANWKLSEAISPKVIRYRLLSDCKSERARIINPKERDYSTQANKREKLTREQLPR